MDQTDNGREAVLPFKAVPYIREDPENGEAEGQDAFEFQLFANLRADGLIVLGCASKARGQSEADAVLLTMPK